MTSAGANDLLHSAAVNTTMQEASKQRRRAKYGRKSNCTGEFTWNARFWGPQTVNLQAQNSLDYTNWKKLY